MNLGFKIKFPWGALTNFEQKIFSGEKNHSIREDPKRRWKVGMKIHMATGIRTKNYRCFCDTFICKSIQDITIFCFKDEKDEDLDFFMVAIDDEYIFEGTRYLIHDPETDFTGHDIEKLAINDGFDSVSDFFKWFNKDFSGVIIHWTDLKY